MDLCTLEDVKQHLGLGQVQDDQKYANLIRKVSAEIEEFLDRRVQVGPYTEIFDVEPNQCYFHLYAFPVTSIAAVYNDSDRAYTADTAVSSADYFLHNSRGRLVFDKVPLIYGSGVLKVEYTGGMAVDTEAFIAAYPSISFQCVQEVVYRFKHRNQPAVVSSAVAGSSVTVVQKRQLMQEVEEALFFHRRVN